MKSLYLLRFLFPLFFSALSSVAQLAGSYTVPGSFSNLASAIVSLNIGGVVGPVTINIQAGYNETVTTGGYSLYAVPGASSVNTITFIKTGSGANPNFISYAGNRYSYQNLQDGLWRLIGADFITIENLSFTDNRTSNPNTMEFGISLLRANAYDGCQYNVIRNCTFSLKRENNSSGAGIGAPGSRAIEITGASTQNHTLAISPLSNSGSHRFNLITGNYIQNCNYCIALTSSYTAQGSLFMDADNYIGGSTAVQGNTISGYGSSTFPADAAAGIYFEGQQGLTISSNSISSLPSSGFQHTDTDLYGIRGKNNNYNISITNNTLSIKNGSQSMNLYGIRNEGISAFAFNNNIKITGNRFAGFQSTYQYTSGFHGIYNSIVADTILMSSNTFTQNSTFTQGLVSLIRNSASVAGLISMSNNILSINSTIASTLNLINHSGSMSSGRVSINGNLVRNLVLGNGTAAFQSDLISISGTNRCLSVNSNTFLSLSYDNTGATNFIINTSGTNDSVIVNANSVTGYTATQSFYGHLLYFYRGNNTSSSATSTVQISNNTITAFSGLGSSLVGISSSEGPSTNCSRKLIFNNSFTNLAALGNFTGIGASRLGDANGSAPSSIFNNTVTNVFGGNYCVGIDVSLPTGSLSLPPEIRSNVIFSLTGQTTNTGGLYGIRATAGGGMTIAGNIISNVANTTTFTCAGINLYSSPSANDVVNIYNNIVAHVKNSGQITFFGSNSAMLISGGSRFNVYYNTLLLDSPVPMGATVLSGLAPNVDSRNNLIVNYAVGNGYGNWAACLAGATNYSATSNNNFYSKSPNNSIIVTLPIERKTMGSFHAAVQGIEMNSVLDTIIFTSTSYTNSGFMTPSPTVPTLVESGAMPISWITTDIYGNPRNTNYPDIGAIEGNYLPGLTDSVPPLFSGIDFINPSCNSSQRTLTVQISDQNGVASGSISPRIYYKVNNGSYTSTSGQLLSGTFSLGVYSFSISASVVPGDIVSWFLIAQDNASNQNIGSWPALGLNAQSVNNVSVYPTAQTYTTYTSLGGTYSVGAMGTFTSLTDAANAYNNSCLTAPVTFVLTNSLYAQPSEVFPIVFKKHPDASATNSLLVIPSPGNSVTINTGTQIASTSVIKFENANHITFNGNNSNNSRMAITCSVSTSSVSALFWLASSNTPTGGCSYITIEGTDLYGSVAEQCYGILASANHSSSVLNSGGAYNKNVTITGNRFSALRCGIFAYGLSALSSYACSNWRIENNQIGPTIGSFSQNLSREGITLQNSILVSVLNNTICNVTNTLSTFDVSGIDLVSGVSSCTIAYNTIRSLSVTPGTSSSLVGINVLSNVSNAEILIHNNMISDLNTLKSQTFQYGGIVLGNLSNTPGGVRIYNNSISLKSTTLTASMASLSGCIVLSSNNNIEIKNNLLHNNVQNSGSTTRRNYCIYLGSNALTFPLTYFDHNNFSSGPEAAFMGNSSTYTSLATVQSVSGQNNNSTNYTPAFISDSDLHLNTGNPSNALLKGTGDAISLYNNDIDNDPRNTTTPDVGADEFSAASCSLVSGGTISPASYTICSTTTLNLASTGLAGGMGAVYQWQQSALPGGTYTNMAYGTGITTPQYNPAGQLAPGVYYVRLAESCPSTSLTSASNEVTLTVVGTPTLNVSQTHTTICAGLSATLSAAGALSFSWSTGATTPSIVVSPTVSTFYLVSYTSNPCGSGISNPISLVTTQAPTLSITGPSSVCAGSAFSLSASGALSFTWNTGDQTASVASTLSTTTIYSVMGNSGGCTGTAIKTVQALPAPTLAISGSTAICPGQTSTLIVSGASSYFWNNSITSSVNPVSPVITTIYSVTGTDAGCSASTEYTVNVITPAPIIITGNTIICSGETTTLSASGYPSFTWAPGGSTTAVVVSPSVNTSYTVSGSGACSNAAVVNVSVNPTPQFTISGPVGVCIGQLVTLSVSGASSFTWSNGSQAATLSLTVLNNTLLTGTGTSTAGCTTTANHSISASIAPQLTIAPASVTVCALSPVSLTASGATGFSWSTGGTGSVLNFTPSASSVLTVTGTINGCSTTQTLAVNTSSLPSITITPPGATVCAQSNVLFNASGAASYTWSAGGGNSSSASFPSFGSSIYTVTGADGLNGCVGSQTVAIITNSLPVIAVFGPTSVCAGQAAILLATGANNYLWSTTSSSPFLIINLSATTAFQVVGTAANGCSSSTGHTVEVVPIPSIFIIPSSATVCLNESTVLTATGANTYVWTNGPASSNFSITPTSSSIYTVTGSTGGCSSSQTVAVGTFSLPLIILSPASATVCAQSPVTFSASGAASYTWSHGGANTATASFTPGTPAIYTITGTDAVNGCTNTATVSVSTHSLPILAVGGNTDVCAGSSSTLIVGGALSYSWSNGNTGSQQIFSPTTSTLYVITGTNSSGCTSSVVANLSVIAIPTVQIVSSSTAVCVLSPVTFTASGANSYTWSNGPISASVLVTPFTSGIYTVTGAVAECSSTQTIAINTLSLPVIGILPSSATVCAQLPITFTASGASSYTWSNGGGNSYTASFAPAASTLYTLTGTDGSNGCTATAYAAVSTNSLPVLSVSGNTIVCTGLSATLNAIGASSYSWSNGNTGSQQIITPGASTLIVISGTNSSGCSSSTTLNLLVMPAPTVQAISSASAVCESASVTFTASGANTYSWSSSVIGSIVTVTPTSASLYTVTGTDNNGCYSSATISVGILTAPSITITASAGTVCPLSSTSLSASGASNYTWTGNVTGSLNIVSPATVTIYTATGTSTVNGCTGTQSVEIGIFPNPSISVSGNTTVCFGLSTTLSVTGASSFSWSTGGTSSITVLSPTSALQGKVTGTTLNGCTGSASFAVVSLSLPVISITGPTTLCSGNSGTLTANGGNMFSWNSGAGTSSILISPTTNTVYSVIGTALNGCSSSASTSITVGSAPPLSIAATNTVVCSGKQVTLTASGGNTYSWSVGSTGGSIVVTQTSASTYTVSSGNNGCVSMASILITSAASPTLTLAPGNIFVCPQTPVSLTVTGASTYTWNGSNTGSVFSYTPLGTTILTVAGTNATSGCTAAIQTTIGTFAVPLVSISGPTVLCFGTPGTWLASGANSYTWSTGHLTSSISLNPLSSATISLSGSNQQGCVGNTMFIYTVQPVPYISVTPSFVVACDDDSVTLTATGATNYTWTPGGSIGSSYNAPSGTGSYTVTGTDPFGCPGNTSVIQITRDTCTALSNYSSADLHVQIYPNPSSGFIEVHTAQEEERHIQIFNNLGILVLEESMSKAIHLINLSHYDKGVYFVVITTGSLRKIDKVILN